MKISLKILSGLVIIFTLFSCSNLYDLFQHKKMEGTLKKALERFINNECKGSITIERVKINKAPTAFGSDDQGWIAQYYSQEQTGSLIGSIYSTINLNVSNLKCDVTFDDEIYELSKDKSTFVKSSLESSEKYQSKNVHVGLKQSKLIFVVILACFFITIFLLSMIVELIVRVFKRWVKS